MQIQFDDIASGEGVLWKVREEEFVDDARTRDTHWTLLFGGGMGGHHPAQHPCRSYRDLRAIIEATLRLAFRALLDLIGRQMQTRLNERMIEGGVLFAAGHERKASHIGEHGSRAILAIKTRASCVLVRGGEQPDTDE
jgi:hypothetical protein